MSTNSLIGKKIGNQVKYIYCHWDGHIETNGRILREYYDEEKLDELLELGSISALRSQIKPEPNKIHTFDKPQDLVVIAYHRDRGDELRLPQVIDEKYYGKEVSQEYNYLFKDGKWYVSQGGDDFIELTKSLVDKSLVKSHMFFH